MSRRLRRAGVFPVRKLLLTACLFIFGCAGGTDVGNPVASFFQSDRALLNHISDQYARSAQPTDLRALTNDAPEGWITGLQSDDSGRNETGATVPGPSEADRVKTDGKYLFIAGEKEVIIVSVASIGAMRVISRIPVPGTVDQLYLRGLRLVILYTPTGREGTDWRYNDGLKGIDVGLPYWVPVNAGTGMLVMDVENPEAPVFLKRMEMDGNLLLSFLVEDTLYLVSQFMPDLPSLVLWHDGSEAGRLAAAEANLEVLKGLTINDVIPSSASYDETGLLKQTGRLISTGNVIGPAQPAGGTLVSVVPISLSRVSEEVSAMGFVADIHYAHASENALFLVSTLYQEDPATAAGGQDGTYRTRIYHLDILGTTIAYAGEGTVNGHILDPYSLSEYNGVLRLAVTSGGISDAGATNEVYCLQNTGKKLEIIGRTSVVPGARLHSARFFGDRGVLATVEQTAPLRTLDLSDPGHPAVVGELRVPGGHTAFLYPLNDTQLLVLGRDTDAACAMTPCGRVSLSLFDTGDMAAPRLLSTRQVGDGGTDSEVFYNRKAFAFRPEEGLWAFPVNLYEVSDPSEAPSEYGENTFNGLYVYRLMADNAMDLVGRMAMFPPFTARDGASAWARGIFLNPAIYAISRDAVTAVPVADIPASPFSLSLRPEGMP